VTVPIVTSTLTTCRSKSAAPVRRTWAASKLNRHTGEPDADAGSVKGMVTLTGTVSDSRTRTKSPCGEEVVVVLLNAIGASFPAIPVPFHVQGLAPGG